MPESQEVPMSVRILTDEDSGNAVFYCSTSEWAFGPVMSEGVEFAERFLKYLGKQDPRRFTDLELGAKYYDFRKYDAEHCPDCGEPLTYKCPHGNCKGCGCDDCEDADREAERRAAWERM
jgi:hypothetical protein